MIKLNIKTRILVFVIFFELFAYTSIQLFNNYIYKKELIQLKQQEIQQTFAASTEKINNLSNLMERNAIDLALSGAHLFSLKQDGLISLSNLEQVVERLLVLNFSSFSEAIGGGLWYEPYTIDNSLMYFGPYAYKKEEKVLFSWDLNTPEYDYHNQSWYTIAADSDWGLNQKVSTPLFWTPPYYDDAGTFSLMMTVDAIMFDLNRQPIGMATVDWSLAQLTAFLESVKISENSYPFFIHYPSRKFISYPKNPKLVMQDANKLAWGEKLLDLAEIGTLNSMKNIYIGDVNYTIYFYRTKSGFVFGSISPISDQENAVSAITTVTLLAGGAIGASFIIIMLVLMRVLFSPFDKVLNLIKNSVSRQSKQKGCIEVEQIIYTGNNEFTAIIQELNQVYGQINSYVNEISSSNVSLKQSEVEINALNEELEDKVTLRTEQLAKRTQEVTASLEKLKATQKQLVEQEKNASLGRLVAGVAHEINTPLGVCVTLASFMEEKVKDIYRRFDAGELDKQYFKISHEELTESICILIQNLNRAADLVASFKQTAVDQSIHEFRQLKIVDYLTIIIRSLKPRLEQTKHKLEFICDQHEIEIYSNPGAILQIITSLVDNALVHGFKTIDAGIIKIQVAHAADGITIEVADNGIGMPVEVLHCIFEPFFTTTRNIGSTGLGMHIVYNLITQQLNGKIECKSTLGTGTCFMIYLPKVSPHVLEIPDVN